MLVLDHWELTVEVAVLEVVVVKLLVVVLVLVLDEVRLFVEVVVDVGAICTVSTILNRLRTSTYG